AALKYKEEHNKVDYLLKPTGSDDYHQIIDFLSASHIRAPELGPPVIMATIDKTPYTITKELVRSRLQLADDGETRVTRQYKVLVFSSKLFANMRLNFAGHPMPLLPTMLLQAQAGDGAEYDHSSDPYETTAGSFLTREDAPLGGDFHTSPLRSTHAPPAGQPSGDKEDPITLTTLSSVVTTLVQK
nr:hypothetical protein [Tanacetum cinerariifolium]